MFDCVTSTVHIKGGDNPVSGKIACREFDSVQASEKLAVLFSDEQWMRPRVLTPEEITRKGEGRRDVMVLYMNI